MVNTYRIRSYDPRIADFEVEAEDFLAAAAVAARTMYPEGAKGGFLHGYPARLDGSEAGPGHFIANYGRMFYVVRRDENG